LPSEKKSNIGNTWGAAWARFTDGPVWPVLIHSVRTAVAAVLSILVARLARLPEAYWAGITTLVITQSSLGAALPISFDRFMGTALGCLFAALVANYFGPSAAVYGVSVFLLGLLIAASRLNRSAYRLGGVALTIVLLIPRTGAAWGVAFHRFAEVSIGIVVALVLTAIWPDPEPPASAAAKK